MKKDRLNIVYEDKDIIVVSKPSGLLTISNGSFNNLYSKVYNYLHKKNQKVFIVHRLDKDTSGLVLFAKNEKNKKYYQDNWNNVIRKYVAVVHGIPKKKKDRLETYLKEDKNLYVYESKYGKLAVLEYELISSNNKYSLLNINLITGRKNQIRVQLNNIGNPIVGDKKYNKIKNNNFYLLAYYLEFKDINNINRVIKLDIPEQYKRITSN